MASDIISREASSAPSPSIFQRPQPRRAASRVRTTRARLAEFVRRRASGGRAASCKRGW